MTDAALYDALADLLVAQFDALIEEARVPARYIPPNNVPPATRAQQLMGWVREDQTGTNRSAVVEALAKVRARTVTTMEPRTTPRLDPWSDARTGDYSASRSPIIIAVEETEDPLGEEQLLRMERHLTVTLDRQRVERLELIGARLLEAQSVDAIVNAGKDAWRELEAAESRLKGVLLSVREAQEREPEHMQPIAWTGKTALLLRICRAVLVACTSGKGGASAIVSVGYGAHYFHPLPPAESTRSMRKRQGRMGGGEIATRTLEITAGDETLLPRIADAISAEVVLLTGAALGQPFQQLADLVGRTEHSATRLAIGFGEVDATPDLLTAILSTLPSVSFAGPALRRDDVIESLRTVIPQAAPYQAVPAILASVRNAAVRRAFDNNDLATFRDALVWTTWSSVGRPLFANQFGEVVAACYPHLMDLRSVASRDWYFDRSEDIPEKYRSEQLVKEPAEVPEMFHLYLSGAGGTGKSCFLRNVYEQLEINQSSVLPVWYKVDAPSSEWSNVEKRVKEETLKAVATRLGKDVANGLVDERKDLRYFLKDLVTRLRQENAPIKELVVFIDQLERTFESGDNPDLRRLETISKNFLILLDHVKVGQGVRIFIASRKQYLPDFLDSFEKALKHKLHFNVLQKIGAPEEQITFAKTILDWCKRQELVPPSVDISDAACLELAAQVKGHPLNMMLALIRTFSHAPDREITKGDIEHDAPWEDLFYVDERLAEKDDMDWFFFLAMAHARTEIVRFSEVWWRLRLVAPALTARVDSLGRQGVLERLWLLGHLGRTLYTRPLGKDQAGFLEFFHANLRDHLVGAVMNYGGKERPKGRRGGTPPVWRVLDRLTVAARDWSQSLQLMIREDVQTLMEQKDVFVERMTAKDKDGKEIQVESFYLLFMRDAEDHRSDLFQAAKECFVYSAVVHDLLGRWAFKRLFPDVSVQVELCKRWIQRCDKASRIKLLQYLVELRHADADKALGQLVFARPGTDLSDVWQQLANILAEPLFAARYRSPFMISLFGYMERNFIVFDEDGMHADRFGEFFAAACNGDRDELTGLVEKMVDDVSSLQETKLQNAVKRLLQADDRIEKWLAAATGNSIDLAVISRETHGYIPPRIELRISPSLSDAVTKSVVETWHRRIQDDIGVPLPALARTSGEMPRESVARGSGATKARSSSPGNAAEDERHAAEACELSFWIDGRVVSVGEFHPTLMQTLRRHWDMEGRAVPRSGRSSYDEALRECVVWVPETELAELDWKRPALAFDAAVQRWLSELLRQHVHDVFSPQDLMPFVESIRNAGDPRLNVREFLRIVSGNYLALWNVVVNLARERVPLASRRVDLMIELQEVVRQTQQTSVTVLTQRLRERARRELCRTFSDETNQLPVMMLEPDTEERLIKRLQVLERRNSFKMTAEERVSLAAAVTAHFESVVRTEDVAPVLLCDERVRIALFSMIQHFDPRIHVLSYAELAPDSSPRSYGFVTGFSLTADA